MIRETLGFTPAVKENARPRVAQRRAKKLGGNSAPQFVVPMMAKLVAEPPKEGNWIYELKFDGFRALGVKNKGVELYSRNGNSLEPRFPEIAEALGRLKAGRFTIDGEIVAIDERGRPSFQMLQSIDMGERPPIFYYAFDLLNLEGEDLCARPLHERKALLEGLLRGGPALIRYSATLAEDPRELLQEVSSHGMEGIIGKRADSPYEIGRRSGAWIKVKCVNEQEVVIGGYTAPEGARKHFGAILVGCYEAGQLKCVGKVGTGYSGALLERLYAQFQKLRQDRCPFANLPEKTEGRWSQNITPARMRECVWLEPKLVCQVKFAEWTRDGKLRHPVFLGLRTDKDPREVVREKPVEG